MDAEELEACHGKLEDSPEVVRLFAELDIVKRPKVVAEVAQIELPKFGLLLGFRQEGPKSKKLRLTAISFYSDEEQGYVPFAGTLPKGLTFADTQAEVRTKLGPPTRTIERYRFDHYVEDNRRLSIRYRRNDDRVSIVMLGFVQ